jgi:hypothetical protein
MIMRDWTREYIKTHPIKALATIKGLMVVLGEERAEIAELDAEIKRLRGEFESIKDDYAFTQEAGLDNRTYAYYETACKALEPAKEDS